MFKILDKNIKSLDYKHSFNITYPRSVNIIYGNYPYPDVINNLIIEIKNNLSDKMENYTNVKGGMTDWDHFVNHALLDKFLTYLINKHQFTHPGLFEFFYNKMFVKNAWGNEIKKGDSVGFHTHPCTHGLLFLSKGCDLIFPELNITITPEPGDYYIFPGEILHGFNKHTGDLNRYTLVFNILQGDIFKFQNKVKELNERKDI